MLRHGWMDNSRGNTWVGGGMNRLVGEMHGHSGPWFIDSPFYSGPVFDWMVCMASYFSSFASPAGLSVQAAVGWGGHTERCKFWTSCKCGVFFPPDISLGCWSAGTDRNSARKMLRKSSMPLKGSRQVRQRQADWYSPTLWCGGG